MTTLFISCSPADVDKETARRMRIALCGEGYNALLLDSHPDDGIPASANGKQTLWQRLNRSQGVIVLYTADWLASPQCLAEAMMAWEQGKPVFMLAAADMANRSQVNGPKNAAKTPQILNFLKDVQFISAGGLTEEEAYGCLRQALAAEGLKDEFPLPQRPYPGLEPFQETDAAVFFGRHDEIERVRDMLNHCRRNNPKGFILLLGPSGCGKSSLVRAGVLPRLKAVRGKDCASGPWVIPPPFSGDQGADGLAISIAHAFQEAGQPLELASILWRLNADRGTNGQVNCTVRSLIKLAGELLAIRGVRDGKLLLVLDQLEEVFATPAGSSARTALRLLLDASADAASPVVVLATMRSDFLNTFQLFEGAAERYEEIILDLMPKAHFGKVIKYPADLFNLRLVPGLTERLIEDSCCDDALPLLAFTLQKLYAGRSMDGALTLEAYQQLGSVSAAIKYAADGILLESGYAGLPANSARMRDLRRAFYNLAHVGEGGQFTRRTARRKQMPPSCEAVLKCFVDQRLLISGINEDGEWTFSVAHEALFRVWDTLHQWLVGDRKALTLCSQIEEAADEWDAKNRVESRMWPEERTLDAVREIESSGVSFEDVTCPSLVRAFLGPRNPDEIATLPALTEADNETAGSGRYGNAWRLPLNHEARASIGVRLALLGDPRRGVGLQADGLPEIDWRRIEGGEVTILIRSDPNNPDSAVVKTLTQAVDPFWIARYPVTIAHFQAFLANCYRDGEWCLPPGLPVDLPIDYPPPKHRARHSNYPADSVTWYDATVFCHWLSVCIGHVVRLPTEYEWQLAATGCNPANMYPWGANWDPQQEPWRANTYESGLNRVTAVGLYPQGASPAGVLDMAGTVWEWCRNTFDDPDDARFPTSKDRRVLRGGSWFGSQVLAQSTFRRRSEPGYRFSHIGFRVTTPDEVHAS